jgi:hypothetical protein
MRRKSDSVYPGTPAFTGAPANLTFADKKEGSGPLFAVTPEKFGAKVINFR